MPVLELPPTQHHCQLAPVSESRHCCALELRRTHKQLLAP